MVTRILTELDGPGAARFDERFRSTKIPVLILAAGASTRMGRAKQLMRLEGLTLLERVIRDARRLSDSVWVVTGCRGPLIRYRTRYRPHHWVRNPGWQEGLSSSLRVGIAALPLRSPGVLVLLTDQPDVGLQHLSRLMMAAVGSPQRAVATTIAGRPMVPAYLPASVWPLLEGLRGDAGARSVLTGLNPIRVPCEAAAWDLDTPGDWQKRRDRISQGETARNSVSLSTVDRDSTNTS